MKTTEQWAEEDFTEYLKIDDPKWHSDLLVILDQLKKTYPQSKTHKAAVTVKASGLEVSYSVSITRGDL